MKRNSTGQMTEQDMRNHLCFRYIEKLGEVEVRSESVVIGDAVVSGTKDGNASNTFFQISSYDQSLDTVDRPYVACAHTGLGNGRYPVFAEVVLHPELGRLVVALHVPFWPESSCPDSSADVIANLEEQYISELNQPLPSETIERYRGIWRAERARREQLSSTRRKRRNTRKVPPVPSTTESQQIETASAA